MIDNESNMARSGTYNDDREKSSQKIYVQELVVLLRELSKLLSLANPRNPELAQALSKLASTLARYKNEPVDDVLANIVIQKPRRPTTYILKTSKTIAASEAKDFTLEHIERLLDLEKLSKPDLISIAVGKFGMSKADMMKTRKEYVVEAIKTAIGNLRTIDIIGRQASGNDTV